jgi:hypothetical protein
MIARRNPVNHFESSDFRQREVNAVITLTLAIIAPSWQPSGKDWQLDHLGPRGIRRSLLEPSAWHLGCL